MPHLLWLCTSNQSSTIASILIILIIIITIVIIVISIPMPRSLLHAAVSFPCEPSEPQESDNHDHCQHNQWPPPFPHHDHHPDYHHANVQFILSPLYAASSPPCEPSEPQECHCPSCPLPLWANFDDMISSFWSGGHNTKQNRANSRRKTFLISE